MGRKNLVFWYVHPEGHGNFGDELNPYIISKLSTRDVQLVNGGIIINKKKTIFKNLVLDVLKGKTGIKKAFESSNFKVFFQPTIIPIGSVIERYRLQNCIIWGSGIMFGNREIQPAKFLAVRGKYTQNKLKELGYKAPEILGDPALLLPLVYQPKELAKKYKIGIIPHFRHYERIAKMFSNNDSVKIINILDKIEKIINEICSCEITFSTSLHGIIASHAYGVKSVWTNFNHESLAGGNIKFFDYFSSVNIPEYEAIQINSSEDILSALNEFSEAEFTLPAKTRISEIQNELLSVAPFELKPEFNFKR